LFIEDPGNGEVAAPGGVVFFGGVFVLPIAPGGVTFGSAKGNPPEAVGFGDVLDDFLTSTEPCCRGASLFVIVPLGEIVFP
jgi:hypothetical protein